MKVLVPLAAGMEEIEAVTIIDVLRRAGIDTVSAALGENPVAGSHGIAVNTDTSIDAIDSGSFGCIALPGGMPGSQNLADDARVNRIIRDIHNRGGILAAICAAPMVLGRAGLLDGKKATCYPGFQHELLGAEYIPGPFILDGNILTGKGPGCAIPFALKLVEMIKGKKESDALKEAMQVYWI
ncbi:MAG TPA: DJ-1/PfpI family protein [Spirochaetota bacterium]|nr:DJ-1/PfpI family protein [Spirochaetota bacterium]HRZ26408.1 DJ-1/PfpI family protein [Spirochaetota bacterium]